MSGKNVFVLLSIVLGGCGRAPADRGVAASDWVLQRATMSGACHVQPAPAKPELGALLASKPSRKAACQEALARKTDDAADTGRCFAYTRGAISECAKEGIVLP